MRTPTNGRLDTPTWQLHPHHRHTSHMIIVNKVGKRRRTALPIKFQNTYPFQIKAHHNDINKSNNVFMCLKTAKQGQQ
jgi:hypothetical protein